VELALQTKSTLRVELALQVESTLQIEKGQFEKNWPFLFCVSGWIKCKVSVRTANLLWLQKKL